MSSFVSKHETLLKSLFQIFLRKLGHWCSADSRVPSKVFHQRGVFWHLFDVLPVFICQMREKQDYSMSHPPSLQDQII